MIRIFPEVRVAEKLTSVNCRQVDPEVEAGVPFGCDFSLLLSLPWEPKRKCRGLSRVFGDITVWPFPVSPCLLVSSTHLHSRKAPEFIRSSIHFFIQQTSHCDPGNTLEDKTDPHGSCILASSSTCCSSPCGASSPLGPVIGTCSAFMHHHPEMWELSHPPLELCALSSDTEPAQSWPWKIFLAE